MCKNVFYIVGVGRSGTSLLQSMFAAHPEFAYLPETSFVRRFVSVRKIHKIYKKSGVGIAKSVLKNDVRFSRIRIEPEIIFKSIFKKNVKHLDLDVYNEVLSRYLFENDVTYVVDKDPKLIEYLPLLNKINKKCYVIHIYRDPREVLLSKKKAEWSKNRHVWRLLLANRVQFRLGSKLGKKIFGERYCEICYEELLRSPEQELQKLCGSLGIEYSEMMLSFGDAAKRLVSEDEKSWKKETFNPLQTNNVEKWKKELQYREVLLTEKCCNDVMVKGNYKNYEKRKVLDIREWVWFIISWLLIQMATLPYICFRKYIVWRACKQI